ncbi:MAG: HAMP domain-containing sensor histidine kinase [Firmicutes bacterium]|nr:HAMP domain-containing sensor histidine kinase [Bacillota bacterium]
MQFNPENLKDDAANNGGEVKSKLPRWMHYVTDKVKGFFSDVRHMVSRTLFTKYLFVTSALLICSFVMLGLIMATLISNRWQDEKQQTLAENAHIVADGMNSFLVSVPVKNDEGKETIEYHITDAGKEKLRSTLGMLSSSCGADIFIVDAGGNTVICSEEYLYASQDPEVPFKCRHTQTIISASIIANAARVKEYRTTDKLGGIYNQNHFIVSVPFIAADDKGNEYIAGFVFVASSASTISVFRSDIFRIVTIAVIIASIISFGLVYMLTYQQVRPLRQMARAAGKFAEGDFSVRVPVTSENEVGQLAVAFNEMATKLSVSESMNRSFIANVSHELKTPMTTISGFIDGILDGTIPYEKQGQYLRIVSAETKRLARLVRSMLDLSKIDSGEMKLNRQKFNLCETIFDTMLSFEHRIDEKHIEIQGLEELRPTTVNGDADLIHQVVYNLMDNAVKFTNDGGYIRVSVSVKSKVASVSICNSGIGVPSDELPHIFERFYKTDKSRSFDKQGVGLGLFIVKTIISLHGGTIRAESAEGKYCNVIFTLPEASEGGKNLKH